MCSLHTIDATSINTVSYMAVAGDDDDDSLFVIRIGYKELQRLYRSRCD